MFIRECVSKSRFLYEKCSITKSCVKINIFIYQCVRFYNLYSFFLNITYDPNFATICCRINIIY